MEDTPRSEGTVPVQQLKVVGFGLKDVKRSDGESRYFLFGEIPTRGIVLGRDPECDFVVGGEPGSTVSRRHAIITVHGETCYIEDISKNGTMVERLHGKFGSSFEVVNKVPVALQEDDRLYLSIVVDGGGMALGKGGSMVRLAYLKALA